MSDLLVLNTLSDHMKARVNEAFDPTLLNEVDPDSWFSQHGSDIRFVLTDGPTGVPADVLAQLPHVEIISNVGVGYDGVDTDVATQRGIPVCHTPNVLNQEVATTAVMLYLACWRNLEAEMALARSGRWASEGNLALPRTADDRCVGILGFGRIGKAVAAKLSPWTENIVYHGRTKQEVPQRYYNDLIAMARDCETLICIAPGGQPTRNLINREVMDAIGPDGFLINIGRGSTVDEVALVNALQEGTLGGAGLDVFVDEPNIPEALRAMSNTVLLPHIGSASVETRRAMADLAIDNLIAWKEGRPLLSPVPESASLL